jgi:hypothetical protein
MASPPVRRPPKTLAAPAVAQVQALGRLGAELGEESSVPPQVEVVGVGPSAPLEAVLPLDHEPDQTLGRGDPTFVEEESARDAEDGGVAADPQREADDGREGEPRVAPKLAYREPQVVEQAAHSHPSARTGWSPASRRAAGGPDCVSPGSERWLPGRPRREGDRMDGIGPGRGCSAPEISTSSPTSTPPASTTSFQAIPKSFRFTRVSA